MVWLAIIALLLGFVGNVVNSFEKVDRQTLTTGMAAKVLLDSVPPSFSVFRPKIVSSPGTANWPLTLGRAIGSIVAFAAILTLLWVVLKEQVEKFRISVQSRHTLFIGFDKNARHFLKSKTRPQEKPVVVVDPDASEKTKNKVHASSCLYYPMSEAAGLVKSLSSCSVKKASSMVISTGEDDDNLGFVRELADSGILADSTIENVVLSVESKSLLDRLAASDTFMHSFGDAANINLFNYDRKAAVGLMERTAFAEHAVAQNQSRVRLVVFGQTDAAIETVIQYVKVSPVARFEKPLIDWVIEDREALIGKLSKRSAALANLIKAEKSSSKRAASKLPLSWAVEFKLHVLEENSNPASEEFLTGIASSNASALTSVIIAMSPEDENTLVALAIREVSGRLSDWQVPIYVLSPAKSSVDIFLNVFEPETGKPPKHLKNIATTDDRSQVIEPFGRAGEIFEWMDDKGAREILGCRLHEAYVAKRMKERQGNDEDLERDASMMPWHQLSETYRDANRRAADRIPMMEVSAQILGDDNLLEELASLEHDAWWIDRELDGWQLGKRDNARKLHPDLIPYSELTDATKDYDRSHVAMLLDFIKE